MRTASKWDGERVLLTSRCAAAAAAAAADDDDRHAAAAFFSSFNFLARLSSRAFPDAMSWSASAASTGRS